MTVERADVAVIGGGLVGLATAYQLLRRRPDLRLALVEKEPELASHQSGHNSGVLHAGLYYPSGSLKARMCREGKAELELFAESHGIPVELCGKLVVALDASEVPSLEALRERAEANGVPGLETVGPARIRELEPHAAGVRALWSPTSGVTDFRRVALAIADEIRSVGGTIETSRAVTGIAGRGREQVLTTTRGDLVVRDIVACAGLWADRVAAMSGDRGTETIVPFRGDYYRLTPDARHLVRGLIYPVPDPRFPFLGVHFTRRIDGAVWAGPNAVLAFAREGYRRRDIDLRDLAAVLGSRGFLRLAARYWRTGAAEFWRDWSKKAFLRVLRRYVPELGAEQIAFGPSGVRAQALDRDGRLVDDFRLGGSGHVLHVRNAPSPAATASLAIGREIAAQAIERFDLAEPRPGGVTPVSLIDELRASWPPGDPAATSDHVRPSAADTRLLDACALPSTAVERHAVAVASGPDERLCLVLLVRSGGAWHLARAGDGASEALVAALAGMRPLPKDFTLRPLGSPPETRGERAMGVDQTNESVVVGEAVVVKWLLRPSAAEHPAPAILAHLAALGYVNVPRPLGSLTWMAPDGARILLALVDRYLPGARDGWDWCVAAVLEHLGHLADGCAGGCAADLAAELGSLTAGLHVALATPSAVLPVAVTRADASDVVRWRSAAERTMREAGALTEGSDGEEVRARLPAMMAALTALSDVVGTPVQRVHGDLHVGQVLRWREGLAIIDFDGNPAADPATAALPQPAARDVAGMLRSLDHVGRIVDEQTGRRHHAEVERWIARSRRRFLFAYRRVLADAGRSDLLDERLMPLFEVEQECRELVYAARFLPRWRYAPMAALRAMLPP